MHALSQVNVRHITTVGTRTHQIMIILSLTNGCHNQGTKSPLQLKPGSTPGEERRLVLESLSERVAEVPEAFRSPNVTPGPVDEDQGS